VPAAEASALDSNGEPRASLPDFAFAVNPQAAERSGVEVATATPRILAGRIRVPGRIEPNAYRAVTVTPLVAGRVLRVPVELGDRVAGGQTLAVVYGPELAEAQTRFLSMKAQLDYDHQRLRRTERLVAIGAASQQELEEVRAVHTGHATEVEGARTRLLLLGIPEERTAQLSSPDAISAEVNVPAPVSGVVIERVANVGLVVEPAMKLFTVADLSSVWGIGAVYERDFAAIRVGSSVVLKTPAYPGVELGGRVSYIDPQVSDETRTASVRVGVANPEGKLRLGMYVDMEIETDDGRTGLAVPRESVQTVGARSFVYLVDSSDPGRFVEREVRLGRTFQDFVEILEGLASGEVVVGKGSFYVRAERDRLHPRGAPATAASGGE
jgi:RND family efflux transporter MFP subunit